MTKKEVNDVIESVWVKHLRRRDKIPEDLAYKYSLWLTGVIKQAAPLLQVGQGGGQGGQGGGQGGQPAQQSA